MAQFAALPQGFFGRTPNPVQPVAPPISNPAEDRLNGGQLNYSLTFSGDVHIGGGSNLTPSQVKDAVVSGLRSIQQQNTQRGLAFNS